MSKHTPGPWKTHLVDDYLIVDSDQLALAAAYQSDDLISDETATANARLIAAAPDLLEALKTLFSLADWTHSDDCQCEVCVMARAAIAKAEGKS